MTNVTKTGDGDHFGFYIPNLNLLKTTTMKKILIAFDGSHFSEGAFNFVKTLNEEAPGFDYWKTANHY